MLPTIGELIDALPTELEAAQERSAEAMLAELIEDLRHRPVPTGRLLRVWTLGTLPAKVAAAYLAWWVRGLYGDADQRQRDLNETHLRAALKLLGTMGYLRGAAMKMGQILANYPDVVPAEFAGILGRLHFEAPPMHFSLLRELVINELGAPPEELFDDFETEAFAAASLGQVHRARLKGTDDVVAIKIQYPYIAVTIREDLRALKGVLAPMRLSGDWDSIERQFDDVRCKLEQEIDYEHEAENLRIARDAFTEADEIVVPGVHEDLSTKRVLTMEHLPGRHLRAFLAANPGREQRDRHGTQIARSTLRLSYGAHLLYADPHPGNYLFMPDGRLGLIDFGCCHRYSDEDIDYMTEVEKTAGSPQALREALIRAADMTPRQQQDEQRFEVMERWCEWLWEPFRAAGPFDFGDRTYFRRGVELYGEMLKRRYVRSVPLNTWLTKTFFGLRAMLTHLEARVDLGVLAKQEAGHPMPYAD